jgi:type IV secretion system protein VirB9
MNPATALLAALALPTTVLAATDPRIRDVDYTPGSVYALAARVGFQIDLQFETGEKFVGLAAGDVEAVGFEGQDNHVFLKPKAATVNTNLTILTDRRPYYFEYSVTPATRRAPPTGDALFALRFHYAPPPEPPKAVPVADALDAPIRPLHTRYRFCGARALRPTGAWDDGVRTHLTFSAQAELPALFVLNEDNTESLVNFTVTAEGLTLHRIAHRFVLRRGSQTGCVINDDYEGSGTRLPTGTVSDTVQREAAP